ncbi:competence protein ComK [Bacillus suaedae]|uniref:Competence protein ComK n=1 Tax=Halalkalibacter suaedae TaxID=2822140 RepID=A0A941AU03_9BACI|nr:competence protein ComK [Bacillus suaedae]MBP3953144.1 competence protein ComK [Bacillus suaedae]
MNQLILQQYDITKDTMALIPGRHTDYETLILEPHQQLAVTQSALSILKIACLEGGSTYDGRRQAVIHQTGAQSKVPIPIYPKESIFTFPTHSANSYECIWLFYHHIKSIKPHEKKPNYSIVTFKNYQTFEVNVSYQSLMRQLQRTSYCIVKFGYVGLEV